MGIENLKVPPHSIEAEQSVLGGLMLHNDAWDKVSDIITERDFYNATHKIIFNSLWNLLEANETVDILIVKEFLQKYNNLDNIGGFNYLVQIADSTPSVSNIDGYAKHIRELSVLRDLIISSNEIASMAYAPKSDSVDKLLDTAEKKIFEIAESVLRKKKDIINVKDILEQISQSINENQQSEGLTGLSTGFNNLDSLTSGLQKGDLIVIGGRPSMGKTAFVMNLVENIAINGKKTVVVFSLEMSTEQLVKRMIASIGHINATKMRDGGMTDIDWESFNNALKKLKESNILIDESPSITPTEIRSKCRRLKRQYPDLSLVMVDYLQLMSVRGSNSENRVQEISEISRSLKSLAKELNIPVIAISQLNRGVEFREKKNKGRMPQMADLRESGAIEQDADIIAFIYRDERYHGDDYINHEEIGKADINVVKHRNGEVKVLKLAFIAEYAKFDNLAIEGKNESFNYLDNTKSLHNMTGDSVKGILLSDVYGKDKNTKTIENEFENDKF